MPRKQALLGCSIGFFGILCIVALCLGASGCGDSCVSGIFNPPNSSVQVKTCSLTTTSGMVSVGVRSSGAPAGEAGSLGFRHMFVTISGIEVFSESSSEWREIAPALESKPVQVDLLAGTSVSDGCAQARLAEAQVPPGDYTGVRLRLASESADIEFAPGENQCRPAGVNCAVAPDGTIRPLTVDGNTPELRIAPRQISGVFFRVMPDTQTDLSILFDAAASRAVPLRNAVHLAAVFSAEAAGPCPAVAAAEPMD